MKWNYILRFTKSNQFDLPNLKTFGSSNIYIQSVYVYFSVIIFIFPLITAWKVSKYGVFSDPYFPVFSPNTGKYGPEITPYLNTFHAVHVKMVENNRIFFLVSPYWNLGFSRKDNIKFSEENLAVVHCNCLISFCSNLLTSVLEQ